jgi:hypothetical protein
MIKFFRQIRQQLLLENKTTKYFKYAIGEIILVVIGILIALQINNWKQEQQNKTVTIDYLEDFKKDLINDTILFNQAIKRASNTIRKDKAILETNDFNLILGDSLFKILNVHHSMRIYQINNSTYSKLLNTGFTEAKAYKDLFNTINLYYTVEYKTYGEYIEWDKEQTIDMYNSEFSSNNNLDFSKITNTINEDTRNGIISFILSNQFRNRLFADYTRKESVVNRIIIQKELATELLYLIDTNLIGHD